MNELVSIIVPVYNSEKFLPKCIESICAQSYNNLEIILVDDGSSDNSGKICAEYAQEDQRIKVIYQKNQGVSVARNIGLDNVRGEVICFVDSDDYIDKDLLQDNLAMMDAKSADVVCFNHADVFDDGIKNRLLYTEKMSSWDIIVGTFTEKLPESVCGKLYKKCVWDNIRFPIGYNFEDAYVLPIVFKKANKIVANKKIYYFYNQINKNSIMHTTYIEADYLRFRCACNKVQIAGKEWDVLHEYASVKALEYGIKAYNYNIYIKYLDDSELKEMEEFFIRNKKILAKVQYDKRIYLLGYFYFPILNKIKGKYYFYKAKNKKWIV